MPQVVAELLGALASEETTAVQLEWIIETDQALAAKVLALANSSYYSFYQKITTIQRAVVAIGFRELRVLSLGAALASVFDPSKMPAGFDGEGLWFHCLATSLAARELGALIRHPQPGELQAAALLHDLGKLVAAICLGETVEKLMTLVDEGRPYDQAEAELEIKHTTVGYWLAHKWGLPQIYLSAILYHHNPLNSDEYRQNTCLVHLADRAVKDLELGMVHQAPEVDLDAILAEAGLSLDQVKAAAQRVERLAPSLLEVWQLIL